MEQPSLEALAQKPEITDKYSAQHTGVQSRVEEKYAAQLTDVRPSNSDGISVTPVINFSPAIQNSSMRSILKNVVVSQTYVPIPPSNYTDIQNLGPGEQIFEMGQEKDLEQSYLEAKMGDNSQAVAADSNVDRAFLTSDRSRDKLFTNDDLFSQENMDRMEQSEGDFSLQEQRRLSNNQEQSGGDFSLQEQQEMSNDQEQSGGNFSLQDQQQLSNDQEQSGGDFSLQEQRRLSSDQSMFEDTASLKKTTNVSCFVHYFIGEVPNGLER